MIKSIEEILKDWDARIDAYIKPELAKRWKEWLKMDIAKVVREVTEEIENLQAELRYGNNTLYADELGRKYADEIENYK